MAFKNGLSERLDELRFPSPRSPSESPFTGYATVAPAGHPNMASAFSRPSGDVRTNLHRRFTTDSSKLSSWNYLSQPGNTPHVTDPQDLLSSTNNSYKSQLFEKKRQHIEYMREQRRRFEEDMKMLDLQHEKEKQEMDQLARDLAKAGIPGPVSEPTTPPEYHDNGFAAGFSRPSRFSTSSVTSSPGFFNVFAPSNQTVSSPNGAQTPTNRFSVHSVPGSRRNSEKEDFGNDPLSSPLRPGPAIHRYSMPTANLSQFRGNAPASGFNNPSGLDSFSAAKYLFPHDDDRNTPRDEDRLPTPDIKSYLQLTEPDDKFPTLSRRDESGLLSANPDALDLANSRTPNPESWNAHNRHRASHQSMPQSNLNMFRLNHQLGSPTGDNRSTDVNAARHAARHSLEANLFYGNEEPREHAVSTASSRPTSLQSSYSTNDLPTVKDNDFDPAITPPKAHLDVFQGRFPGHAANSRQARDSPEHEDAQRPSSQSSTTTLQASAAPFGPQLNTTAANPIVPGSTTTTPLTNVPSSFYGYGMQPYVGNPMQINNQLPNYNPPGSFVGYGPYGGFRANDTPARLAAGARRTGDGESTQLSRFANFPLEHYRGELYSLCKDQHGCRYLQRKLEERTPEHIQMIFEETHPHVVELMTDPFGNYLCQKLLEYSNDEQRTALINNAAPELVKIALNQHGTRALQKMIEFVSTPEQTRTVIRSLENHVVALVQDLNGNHVIQKCLNRLSAEDAQFVYDAVGTNCVVVGTHRHGCCVLQRCIDHASGEQRARLIAQITANAFSLVQDPFGNYVVQYILDLAEPHFTEPLCQSFRGHIPALSKQKFSSNVIEKCLRTADVQMRRHLIEEMLAGNELERMLRDSFANYVVQTAMDFSDPEMRAHVVECIRPILPAIRQTPHGRRIAGKIMASEGSGRGNAATSGQVAPNEMNSAQLPGPLQGAPKPLMYQQNAFPTVSIGRPFGSQNYTPASGSSSGSNASPGGASDSSGSLYTPTAQQPTGNFGAQGPLYAYF